ncbi:MAG: domain containing protein [Chlorobi bacterium]|nr:domain containing protein [Chlorobiota bacterium]
MRVQTVFIMAFIAVILASVTSFGRAMPPAQVPPTPPNLGTTSTYGAFSGAGAIGNTGLTQITGDVGTNAGAFTGFPPGQYSGAKHVADPQALVAKNDLTIAWNQGNLIPCDTTLNVTLGNGQVLTPRTYCSGPASTLTGTMTFDAKGDPSAIFVVKIGGALNAAAGTHVILANGAQAVNIYWIVDGAVSVLDNSIFKGTIIANGSIHLYGGTTLEGRALALVGAVTMASNTVAVPVDGGNGPGNSLIVVRPSLGDSVKGGTQNYQVTWAGTGIDAKKTLDYSLDGGATWTTIGDINTDTYLYNWNVPDTFSTRAVVRITDKNSLTGKSGIFTITSSRPEVGTIVVLTPAMGEVVAGGTRNYNITWTGVKIAAGKTFEYSLDSGATWHSIGAITGDQFNFTWADVPNEATTQALVRISDANHAVGISGVFTITKTVGVGSINSLTLAGLDSLKNIGNNKPLGIGWTFTPDIGESMEVEYSLDYTATWAHIATVQTSAATNTSWMTTPTGYHNSVFVRITSSKGMTRTSEPFSIGSRAAGADVTQRMGGYSVSNYPSPVSGAMNFSFALPVACDVLLTISDGLGREVAILAPGYSEAGTHTVLFDASKLAEGVYYYALHAGSTTLAGKIIVVR